MLIAVLKQYAETVLWATILFSWKQTFAVETASVSFVIRAWSLNSPWDPP
jgi:hypothetical protein